MIFGAKIKKSHFSDHFQSHLTLHIPMIIQNFGPKFFSTLKWVLGPLMSRKKIMIHRTGNSVRGKNEKNAKKWGGL